MSALLPTDVVGKLVSQVRPDQSEHHWGDPPGEKTGCLTDNDVQSHLHQYTRLNRRIAPGRIPQESSGSEQIEVQAEIID